jgi:hypothetical protein
VRGGARIVQLRMHNVQFVVDLLNSGRSAAL